MSSTMFKDGLGYEGKVTLTLKSNNHILKSQTYKNNGTANLFRFLGHCLTGHYSEVKNLLPNKVALLLNPSNTLSEAVLTAASASTGLKEWSQTPSVVSTSVPAEVKVTYSFEIPKNMISGNFNQVVLYGVGCTDPEKDLANCSAFYYLTDNSRNTLETEYVNQWSDTTVLLIDWVLKLTNEETDNI